MPIYEYTCRKCAEVFAVFQSINAREEDMECPGCGAKDVKKNISSFSACSIGGSSGGPSSFGSFGGFGGG